MGHGGPLPRPRLSCPHPTGAWTPASALPGPGQELRGLTSLRHLWLGDNALTEIPVRALGHHLRALQAVTLALNRIGRVPDYAFWNLSSLVVL